MQLTASAPDQPLTILDIKKELEKVCVAKKKGGVRLNRFPFLSFGICAVNFVGLYFWSVTSPFKSSPAAGE